MILISSQPGDFSGERRVHEVLVLVTPVLAIVLRFFRSSFANLAFVLERDQIAGVFLQPVGVGAVVGAAL